MMMPEAKLISAIRRAAARGFARSVRVALSVGLLASVSACIDWERAVEAEQIAISRYITAVELSNGTAKAVLRAGAPAATGTDPVVTAPIPALVLLGGTVQVTATSATPFTKLAVAIPGVDDHWELTLPAAVTSAQILIVFGQDVPTPVFQLRLAGSAGGAYGTAQTNPVSMISVGTGDVQINITWNSAADVDLHVVDPLGEEAFYGHKILVSGGTLDLDSNAGCGSDGPRAENVFWSTGLIAPRGEYVVRVNYWSACSAQRTEYVVTINAKGKLPSVYTGAFVGAGNGGGQGSGRVITTFTY